MPPALEPLAGMLLWSALTIGCYLGAKRLYRRWPRWWSMPMAVTPIVLAAALLALHASYADYLRATGWLLTLLGPAMVAFAVPIYEQRARIRQHWPVLAAGVIAGSATAVLTGWGLATALGLDGALRLSLLPRSVSTPFAMAVSDDIGGVPDLTAIFVVLTGVLGAVVGDCMLARLPIRSPLACGALFGTGAHGIGTARAHELGALEGSVAGLMMVLAGLFNVLMAPLLAYCLR